MPGIRTAGMALAAALAAAACSTTSVRTTTAPRASASGGATHSPFAGHVVAHKPTLKSVALPGWEPVTRDASGVVMDRRVFDAGSAAPIVLMRLRAGLASYALHAGSFDPGRQAYRLGVTARSVVSARERPRLVAAFTGGFALSSGSGGYEQERHVVAPLERGRASLVIDTDGTAHVGVWGRGLPLPGERVFSVRQNLLPLVLHGRPSPQAGQLQPWGATLGGGAAVARTAIGEDSSGNLLFAASMAVTPAQLASALVRVGAQIAMQLDINPEWVQFDYSHSPGGPLIAGIPGQHRPADQYLLGWTRDFITVEARG